MSGPVYNLISNPAWKCLNTGPMTPTAEKWLKGHWRLHSAILPACWEQGRERGRAHSLLANSIQKDADSRNEVRWGVRNHVKGSLDFLPSNESELLHKVNWLMMFWVPYSSDTVRNTRLWRGDDAFTGVLYSHKNQDFQTIQKNRMSLVNVVLQLKYRTRIWEDQSCGILGLWPLTLDCHQHAMALNSDTFAQGYFWPSWSE